MAFIECFRFKVRRRLKRGILADHDHQEHDEKRAVNGIIDGNGHDVLDDLKRKDYGSVRKFTWDEVERLTMNFSEVIGSGGFSTVYLAQLQGSSLGMALGAIKIHIGSERLNQLFKQELDILLRLRHENIVKLLGYCDDGEQGAMVLEYAANGSLQEKLHDTERETHVLSWRNRMTIAFQLAQALQYLHEQCTPQIVHGDIKASNILLDEHLNCKLCDFGSAKMGFSSTVLPPSSSPYSSRRKQVMMLGSPGYTDPHYLKTGMATKKNDVYSFGVVLLELVTGMEAFCPERGQFLTSIASPMLKNVAALGASEVAEMVDPRLSGNYDLEEAKTMLSISAMCLGQSPILRLSATNILQTVKESISSLSPEKLGSMKKSTASCPKS
ncbi:hypothetical protein F2P56_004529 [Juglans regia]|uniref:non-specific serine/threonine protein kinase n=2 Tax=Juglans regia TaxID=51240 RepID=A0A2I4HRW9_JUGRE|nr:probable receptor-like protein kinase At4g10390 [Juglans regia]KAF5477923.1 hypothetical protein F2P56_004529 [Juglans regia]